MRNLHTQKEVEDLMKTHLFDVFGEPNATKRNETMKKVWVASSDSLFLDREGGFHGHDAIRNLVDSVRECMEDLAFELTAPIEVLSTSSESFQVARIRFAGGPRGELPIVFGEHVATIVDGKIKTVYAFMEEGRVVKRSEMASRPERSEHTAHVTRIV